MNNYKVNYDVIVGVDEIIVNCGEYGYIKNVDDYNTEGYTMCLKDMGYKEVKDERMDY